MGEEVRKGVEMEVKEEGGEEVTWEKLLVRVPVRVLLVEGDDSTRQIISALLRKCGYRVTVASDGLKAWDLLREKDHNIDLVLTEVELPNMSGIVLLTMMMDQDSYNHIPVIMMSSNDSVSIAFKCMIKGAADFLVKPIRKNELKNVWQHVWRKQKGGNYATKNKTVDLSYDLHSTKNASNKQDDLDYAEKESDAQSSCTRSDMEVESTFKLKNNMDLKQGPRLQKFSLFDETSPNNHFEKHSNGISLFRNDANGALSLDSDVQPEGKTDCQELELEESSTELIDLIEERIYISENSHENFAENLLFDRELGKMKRKSSMLSLELSLDRYPHKLAIKHEINDGSNTLHHSNSSAFSLYNNNNTMVPKLSQNKESSNTCTEQSPHQSSSTNYLPHTLLIPEPDGTKLMAAACPEVTAFRCTPIRLIPYPVPFGGTSFDRARSNTILQPIFYPQSSPPLWSSIFQKAPAEHDLEARSLGIHGFEAQPRQEEEEEAASGDSASACVSNHSRYNLSENLSAAVSNENNGAFAATFNDCEASCRSGDVDGFHKFGETGKTVNKFQLSQREAALNKFRLKRKERCFEKKVRYLSRKKLAEQRPRVKGQFVRQA